MKSYIEQLEKSNEYYNIYLQNNEAEKNNIFKQNILDRIKSEQFNDGLNLQKRKSLNTPSFKNSNVFMNEDNEISDENANLKKENEAFSKNIIELKNDIKSLKEKCNGLKEEFDKIFNDIKLNKSKISADKTNNNYNEIKNHALVTLNTINLDLVELIHRIYFHYHHSF